MQRAPSTRTAATEIDTGDRMNWFKHRSIATKLAFSFLVVIGLSAALGGFAIVQLSATSEHVAAMTHDAIPTVAKASELAATAADVRRSALSTLVLASPADRAELQQRVDSSAAQFATLLAAYRAAATTTELQSLAAE